MVAVTAEAGSRCHISKEENRKWLKEVFIAKTNCEISQEIFFTLSECFNRDIQKAKSEQFEIQRQLTQLNTKAERAKKFIKTLDKITEICDNDIKEKFIHSLVERIEVHERAVKGSRTQPNVDIHFIGVGVVDFL